MWLLTDEDVEKLLEQSDEFMTEFKAAIGEAIKANAEAGGMSLQEVKRKYGLEKEAQSGAPIETRIPLLCVSFGDGCQYEVHGRRSGFGWMISLPAGMEITCPHGYKALIRGWGDTFRG